MDRNCKLLENIKNEENNKICLFKTINRLEKETSSSQERQKLAKMMKFTRRSRRRLETSYVSLRNMLARYALWDGSSATLSSGKN